ncbi:MAG: hypothetical protein LAT67_05750 [Balneolales bacterium]|nr:hypothetical protein [Balneolales bacterium]
MILFLRLIGLFSFLIFFSTEGIKAQVTDRFEPQALEFSKITTDLRNASSIEFLMAEDRLLVLEEGRHRILKLTRSGVRTDSAGARGSGNGRFDSPSDLGIGAGMQIFVADTQNNRVVILERHLSQVSTFRPHSGFPGINETFFLPKALALNAFGDIFVYDQNSDHILRFDQNTRLRNAFSLGIMDIELPLSGISAFEDQLFLLEERRGVLHFISSNGSYSGFAGGLTGIKATFVHSNRLWALSQNQIYQLNFSGRVEQVFNHSIPESDILKDLVVLRDYIFILTTNSVYRNIRNH